MLARLPATILLLASFITYGSAQVSRRDAVTNSAARYDLHIKVLPEARRLDVSGTMQLSAYGTSRAEINLTLSELMRDFSVEVVEPAVSAGTAKLEKADVSRGSVKWIVHPVRPIPGGENVKLRFSYAGGGKVANQFYVGPEVSFASAWGTDWYPMLEGENDQGIGSINISVPPGYAAIATGLDRSASRERIKGLFRFQTIHPTYLCFAAGKYQILRREGKVPIVLYLLNQRPNMDKYMGGVDRILKVLTIEWGAYRFGEFVLVEVPRQIAQQASLNAAGVQGFVLVNSNAFNAPKIDYLLEWFGHEFSHEWFPNTVALKTPPGRYMEESLAEYGGLRVVETLAGAAAAERFRRTGFEYDPIYSALGYFKLVNSGTDYPLADLQPSLAHHNLAYNKGFLVIDMLSREIGREKFRRIMRGITRRYAFKRITWPAFFHAIELGAGRNLRWFYEQWFERTGAPDFEFSWKQEKGKLRGVITQRPPYYQAVLEIEVKNNQGQQLVRTVKVRGAETSFSFPVNFRVESVTLDPHYLVLRWTPEYRSAANAAHPSNQKSQ